MCRALLYLGQPVLLDDLLFKPESSLVKQAYLPRMLRTLNLAGFGMMAWNQSSYDPEEPYCYRSSTLPVFDRNLKSIAAKTLADCVLAHVRGIAYSTKLGVSPQDTHPFCYDSSCIALAHNGDLYRFNEMKTPLLAYMKSQVIGQIAGPTDSEWIYALLLSQLDDPVERADGEKIIKALEKTLDIIADVRKRCSIDICSSMNLFITNGAEAVAVRYCFDFGRYPTGTPSQVQESNLAFLSMWFTTGREFGFHEGEWKMIGGERMANSLIIASEPLTIDTATWLEVPEYSIIYANVLGNRPSITVHSLPL